MDRLVGSRIKKLVERALLEAAPIRLDSMELPAFLVICKNVEAKICKIDSVDTNVSLFFCSCLALIPYRLDAGFLVDDRLQYLWQVEGCFLEAVVQ